MTKTLDRPLFKKIKNDHRSTGITSGLAYRPGYKVGGRVGFANGNRVNPFLKLPSVENPVEGFKAAGSLGFLGPKELKVPSAREREIGQTYKDLQQFGVEGILEGKRDKPRPPTDPRTLDVFGKNVEVGPKFGDPDYKPVYTPEDKKFDVKSGKYITKETNKTTDKDLGKFDSVKQIKEKSKIKNKSKSQTSKMYDDLIAKQKNLASNRQSLDSELQTLREKQRKDDRLNIALKTLQAMNDPNLRVGQSRVAAGVGAFTDEVIASNKLKAEQETADMLTKYNRLEDDITRGKNMEDYFLKQDYAKQYGSSGERMEQLSFLLEANGAEPGTPLHRQLTNAFFLDRAPNKKDLSTVSDKVSSKIMEINSGESLSYTPNQYRVQVVGTKPLYLDAEGKLTEEVTETEAPLNMLIEGRQVIELMQSGYQYAKGGRVGFKTGGRVGYKEGELVIEEQKEELIQPTSKKAPMVMTKDQLRKKLPEFIDDEIVSLIAYSPNAFADFASIQTLGDADDFNDKYDVRLQLPELDRMDFSGVEEKMSAPAMPITAPTAVPAQPNTATQTGAGANLTPTEVALLDPTEQAIRMRNR
jgi:hypothetical protein